MGSIWDSHVPDSRPHSRACGYKMHPHGSACHPNCPTCSGRDTGAPELHDEPAVAALRISALESEVSALRTELFGVRAQTLKDAADDWAAETRTINAGYASDWMAMTHDERASWQRLKQSHVSPPTWMRARAEQEGQQT